MAARKVGQMIPKGENRWLLRWYTGRSPEGKRLYGSQTFEGTTYQAQRELSRLTNAVEEGTNVVATKQTLRQYLEWWLKEVCANDVTGATLNSYTARLTNDVYVPLGHLKLHKVTWQQIQTLYNDLRKTKSGRTVQYTHTILKQALSHAVKGKLLKANPCDHATPGSKEKAGETTKEMQVWTAAEVQVFLDRTRETPDGALWHTLLNTGLRPGEACALKWSDLSGGRLSITRAVSESGVKGVYVLEAPKTKRSARSITLTGDNIETLQAHRKAQVAEMLAAGEKYERLDFIFPGQHGRFEAPLYPARRWHTAIKRVNKALVKAGQAPLKVLRLYDTRHTHATLLLNAGVNPKIVSERLGHSSIVITLDTYTHVLPDMQDEAVDRLEALMKAASGRQVAIV